ncbi:MAG: hypothetical protein Sylvanvirus6_26 [Sylvanvirus sp.]|uniref:Microbial-type PARG catalytic domain-containing protein n=1 Tax=Sylvanvirus sp. TaxID=2487774 RepID=A0A3G5AHJ8_9VIRU|nr:MAG: hypothetical protein Sylvanvirus6_26 [Sylvanvirus sp.]
MSAFHSKVSQLSEYELQMISVWEHTKRVSKRMTKQPSPAIKYDIDKLLNKCSNEYKCLNESPLQSGVNEIIESLTSLHLQDKKVKQEKNENENEQQEMNKIKHSNPVIDVEDADTFQLAAQYVNEYKLNPLVLNMASDFKPGGGVKNGRTAQEEVLFRCSNAHITHEEKLYPLTSTDILYSAHVTVLKEKDYTLLKKPFQVGMVSCAALRRPEVTMNMNSSKYKHVKDMELMRRKIYAMFELAILYKHDALVLGAFGGGVFRNPSFQVAELFQDAIKIYGRHFKRIGFAVLVVQKPRDQLNLLAFKPLVHLFI